MEVIERAHVLYSLPVRLHILEKNTHTHDEKNRQGKETARGEEQSIMLGVRKTVFGGETWTTIKIYILEKKKKKRLQELSERAWVAVSMKQKQVKTTTLQLY